MNLPSEMHASQDHSTFKAISQPEPAKPIGVRPKSSMDRRIRKKQTDPFGKIFRVDD
jgi:hypothetical protein